MQTPREYSDAIMKRFLDADGSMREIYLQDVSLDDWNKLLYDLKESKFQIRYSDGKEILEIPTDASQIFSDTEKIHLLEVIGGNAFFTTYFYKEDVIEFNLDPREFIGEVQFRILYEFMIFLANSIYRKATLKIEGLDEIPLMEIFPGDDCIYVED